MNDQELLVAAAKAAGITGYWVSDFGSGDYYYQGNADGIYHEFPDGGYTVWNPRNDDGDAMRLASMLKFTVCTDFDGGDEGIGSFVPPATFEPHADNKLAATRRAIARAAAEIGKRIAIREENLALAAKLRAERAKP